MSLSLQLFICYSPMSSMPNFSHGTGGGVGLGSSMGPSPGACLQQRDNPSVGGGMGGSYSCMTRPTYDPIGLGYASRPSPCSPTQPYQMNGHQYNTNGSSSTGKRTYNKLRLYVHLFV